MLRSIIGASLSEPHLVMSLATLSVYIMYGTYVRHVCEQSFVNYKYATSVASMPMQCFGNYAYAAISAEFKFGVHIVLLVGQLHATSPQGSDIAPHYFG